MSVKPKSATFFRKRKTIARKDFQKCSGYCKSSLLDSIRFEDSIFIRNDKKDKHRLHIEDIHQFFEGRET